MLEIQNLDVQHNVSLQQYNSMSVPAQAKYLVTITNVTDARLALKLAQDEGLSVLVLGEGSNTLFENDFDGLVILNRILGKKLTLEEIDCAVVEVGAGENWHDFVSYTLSKNWFGLQNLGLIPGSVGAAPMQNIGAYGAELKDTLVSLDYLDLISGEKRSLSNQECRFGYRDSIFKNELASKTLITSVTFSLSKIPSVDLSYPALADIFDAAAQPQPDAVFDAVCRVRREKLPMPEEIPNTGSFFKNPLVGKRKHDELRSQYPELVSFEVAGQFKLAAGWLIEQAGWKNKSLHGVKVHERQALVITNPKKREGGVVLEFASQIQADIYAKFGVELEIEPVICCATSMEI